jgi:sec-independent protein translocase protein TatB
MFGIGWSEMLVICLIAVLVIGPKDIPKVMYQIGRFARRLQYVKFAMSQQFDEVLKMGDIEELRRGVNFEARTPISVVDEKCADEMLEEPYPDMKDPHPARTDKEGIES